MNMPVSAELRLQPEFVAGNVSPVTSTQGAPAGMPAVKRKVLVCRTTLLPYSETFIREQVLACRHWQAVLVGLSRVDGLPLDDLTTRVLLNKDSWRQRLLRVFNRLPAEVATQLQAERADLIHIHFGVDAVAYWPAVKSLGLPVVITLHGYDINRHPRSWGHPLTATWAAQYPRRLLHIARQPGVHFIAVSEAIRQRAIEYGIDAERISVQYIGIDTRRFHPAGEPLQLRRRILFVGRLVEKKGVQVLLDALGRVRCVVDDVELIVVGDGPLMSALRLQVAQRNLPVEFLGSVSSAEIKRQLDAARVFCLPSVTARDGDAEGLGLALLEAQACGVPVITSARGGATEGMIDGVTGFAFAEHDDVALADRLMRVLRDDSPTLAMSIAARQFVVDKFDLQHCTRELEALYDRLVSPA